MVDSWYERWVGLKHRRILAFASLIAWIVAWIAFGAAGLLAGFLFAFSAYIRLRSFPCPRCQLPIVGVRLKSFPDRCEGCGLQVFGHEYDVPEYVRNPDIFTMSRRLRRTIAGYEIGSGVVLMLFLAFMGGLPLWYQITAEGLAAFSLAAGWWLWRDDVRGYRLTRTLQVIQLVRVQSSVLVYVATAGIAIDLLHANGVINISPSFAADLKLRLLDPRMSFGAAVNLWAAAVFLLMLHAKPAPPQPADVSPATDGPLASVSAESTPDGTLPPVVGASHD